MPQGHLGTPYPPLGRNIDRAENPGSRYPCSGQEIFQQIFDLVDKYDLYGQVAYPKYHRRDQIASIYRWAADLKGIFVNPALTEPFGLTLLEAAA